MFWAAGIAALCGVFLLIYLRTKSAKHARRVAFVEQFNPQKLRMNRINKTIVYQVTDRINGRLRVKTVWSDTDPIQDGKEYMVEEAEFAPFDRDLFVSGW